MASVFTRIISGQLPGHFVWKDPECVVLLSINPIRPGHCLVVPRSEVDHWIDLEPGLARHLFGVAREIGCAQQRAFKPARIGLIIAGLEVPHTHLHVIPIRDEGDLSFGNAERNPAPETLTRAAQEIRTALKALGSTQVSGHT